MAIFLGLENRKIGRDVPDESYWPETLRRGGGQSYLLWYKKNIPRRKR